jgi:excinuclease ABC subunit C
MTEITPRHSRPPHSTPAHRKQLRALVREGCENRPGVYRMLGSTGNVLYIGQSRVLRTRLLSYFRATGRRNKAARILRHAFQIEWEYTPTEFGALLRELRLIKQYRPPFNSMMVRDEWPRGYVALTGGAVPGLTVVNRSDHPQAMALFGPFRRVSTLREAVRSLAEATGIRDCTHDDVGRGSIRSRVPNCLRHDLGTCPGPCIGEATAETYQAAAHAVRDFLDGKGDAPIRQLEAQMHAASTALAFEHAAVIRDRLANVSWLHQRVQHFHANVDRLTFRYHALGPDGQEWVYLIRRGTVRAERAMPTSDEERAEFRALQLRVYSGPDPTGADIPTHDLDEFYLVASWFRRRPAERKRARPAEGALRASRSSVVAPIPAT